MIAHQGGDALSLLIQVIPVEQITLLNQRGVLIDRREESGCQSGTMGGRDTGNAVNGPIGQIHLVLTDAIGLTRFDRVGHDSLLVTGRIDFGRDIDIHISFVDEEPTQLLGRLAHQGGVQNDGRFAHPTQLPVDPPLVVPSGPSIDKQLPLGQSKHLEIGLLPQIRLEIFHLLRDGITTNNDLVQEVLALFDILGRAAGRQESTDHSAQDDMS